MSDVSVLSHEYKTASELSQSINQALIVLKKTCLRLPGAEAVTPEELDTSQHQLAEILTALRIHLSGTAKMGGKATSVRIPGSLVSRLRAQRRGDLAYFLADVEQAAARLRQRPGKLTEGDLAVLDQIAAASDAETSSVFRRLMRT